MAHGLSVEASVPPPMEVGDNSVVELTKAAAAEIAPGHPRTAESQSSSEEEEEVVPCDECGTTFTKCWHQMTYEEWLADVSRQNIISRQQSDVTGISCDSSRVEILLAYRARRRRRQCAANASPINLMRPLQIQLLKLHQRRKSMPALLEVQHTQTSWSDDEDDDIQVIL